MKLKSNLLEVCSNLNRERIKWLQVYSRGLPGTNQITTNMNKLNDALSER